MQRRLSPALTQLLESRIDTFEKLDIVIALHAAPRSTLSIDELSRILLLPRETIRRVAGDLRDATLVELTLRGEVQLLPPTIQERTLIDVLVATAHADRVSIVRVMGEIALERIREAARRANAPRKHNEN